MRKKFQWEWETLDRFTMRAKVIGGWIVVHQDKMPSKAISESMVFVPDRDHEWHITFLPKEIAENPDL